MIGSVVTDGLQVFQWAVLAYFVLVNAWMSALLVSATFEMRRHRLDVWQEGRWRLLSSNLAPSIAIIAPAYNEALTVTESVRSLLTLSYPTLEVVVVNDGSADATLEVLARDFDLVAVPPVFRRTVHSADVRGVYRSRRTPSLIVVDKENGGKADALNAGLNVAGAELVCAIDSDTLVEPDALQRMVRPFLLGTQVIAAGGTIRVVNGSEVHGGRVTRQRAPRRFLAAIQATEYLRAFLAGRLGWNRLGGNIVISGAFGLFRRSAVLDAGGYLEDTVGEDMELVARLRRIAAERRVPGHVHFVPDPVAWTEVPTSLRVLGRQRDRWHRGLADVLWRHRRLFGNPRYGVLGLAVVPYFVIVELLAPIVELLGLASMVVGLALGAINIPFAILFLAVAYGFGLLLTVLTVALDEWTYRAYGGLGDRLLLVAFSLLEGAGYRQLTAIWRVRGLWKFARGHSEWGVMTREGFSGAPPRQQDPADGQLGQDARHDNVSGRTT
jgi:cellulose synthase/poly-beta-1,6-N-acetylglucosamine synthase-like glycosyltransferase